MQLVFFRPHLVLHACAARFDVMGTAQKILGTKHALNSTNVQDDLWLYSCKAVLGRCPHSSRRRMDGAEAAGNCSAQPCPRQTLRNVPPPMLLAHLEKKKQHCLQE